MAETIAMGSVRDGRIVWELERTDFPYRRPELGHVYRTSWGYDQTNSEFFEVVAVSKSGKSVKLHRIATRIDNTTRRVHPIPGEYVADFHEPMPTGWRRWHGPQGRSDGFVKVDTTGYIRHAWPYDLASDGGAYDTIAAGHPGH